MTDYSRYDNHIFKFIVANTDWFTKADKNSDGILLSGEFTSYLESSMNLEDWNGEVTSSKDEKDILKNFFSRMIDTNKTKGHIDGHKNIANEFAADEDEIENFTSKKIENYNIILCGLTCPDYIEDQDAWKMQAATEIVALYGKNTSDISNFVETDACQDILAKITSKMLYEQCMNDVVNQLQSQAIYVGSKPLSSILSEDTTLKTIVEKYVEDICKGDDTKFDSDQMEKDVKGIINKYFNYAGLDNLNIKLYDSKEDSTDDNVVASYSGTIQDLNNRELTSLQINVAQAEIYSRVLSEFQQDYLDYYTEFPKYAKAFVNSIIAVVPKGSWENNIPDWDSLAAQFATSTAKINLDSYIDSIKNPPQPEVEEPPVEEPPVEEPPLDEPPVIDEPPVVDEPEESITAESVYTDIKNSKGSFASEWHKRAAGYNYYDKIAEEIENDLVYWLSKGKTYDYDEMKSKDEFKLGYSEYNEKIYGAIDKTRNLYKSISINSDYEGNGVKVYRPDPDTNQYDYNIDFQTTRNKFLEILKGELGL